MADIKPCEAWAVVGPEDNIQSDSIRITERAAWCAFFGVSPHYPLLPEQIERHKEKGYRCERVAVGPVNAAPQEPLATKQEKSETTPVNGTDKPGEKGLTPADAAPRSREEPCNCPARFGIREITYYCQQKEGVECQAFQVKLPVLSAPRPQPEIEELKRQIRLRDEDRIFLQSHINSRDARISELNDELATLQPAEALLREAREYVLAYEMGADTDKGRPGAKNLLARIDAHRKESGHDR